MKFSIVTINYNNAQGLTKTIQSIVSQSYKDFEYIVIDGGSTDNSVDVIKEHSDKIAYWVSEPDKGVYNAMNKGIKAAKGDYILFINSGDYIVEDTDLTKIATHLTGDDFIYFNLRLLFNTGEIKVKEYPDYLDFKYFTVETLPHPATFIKRQLFLDLGLYNEQMKICSDWAFFLESICLKNCTYKYVDESFSLFCLDGMSFDKDNKQIVFDEKLNFLKEKFPLYVSLFEDWYDRGVLLNTIKTDFWIRVLKKMNLIKWI